MGRVALFERVAVQNAAAGRLFRAAPVIAAPGPLAIIPVPPMKIQSTLGLLLVIFTLSHRAAAAPGTVVYEPKDGPGKGEHVVLVSGDEEYRSEEGLPMLGKILSQRHGFRCTVLFAVD